MSKAPEKYKVTEVDLVMLGKAKRLKVLSTFESNLINNMVGRYAEHGQAMVVTKNQQKVLITLARRYDKVWEKHI